MGTIEEEKGWIGRNDWMKAYLWLEIERQRWKKEFPLEKKEIAELSTYDSQQTRFIAI